MHLDHFIVPFNTTNTTTLVYLDLLKLAQNRAVIHTIAHILNVINFSRNYDPFLSTLNMANYAGQAPIELLLSGE